MKNKNLILGGVLMTLGIGAFLFFKKKNKVVDVVENLDKNIEKTVEVTNLSTEPSSGKSTITDIPINKPIRDTNIGGMLENAITNTVIDKVVEAKQISEKIAENKRKQRSYKKISSKRNIQTVIDADIAKLLALGYMPLENGEIQKV